MSESESNYSFGSDAAEDPSEIPDSAFNTEPELENDVPGRTERIENQNDDRSSAGRRNRGTRGGRNQTSPKQHGGVSKYRTGPMPMAPPYDGDVEKDPKGYDRYVRRVEIWRFMAKDFAPPEELALKLLEKLDKDAADEFEHELVLTFAVPDGIDKILARLSVFKTKQIHASSDVIRKFEHLARDPGESIHKHIRHFKNVERELRKYSFERYLEYARCVKLLDGSKLSEEALRTVLTSAGNN